MMCLPECDQWQNEDSITQILCQSHPMLDTLHKVDECDTLAFNVGFQVFAALFK